LNLSLAALIICLMSFSPMCGRSGDAQKPQISNGEQRTTVAIKLTNVHAVASFPVTPETLKAAPPILELSVTKVVNTAKIPVTIFVSFSPPGAKAESEPEKIPIGNFSLYPPDLPGKFLLPASDAFRKLKDEGADLQAKEVRLQLEMKPIHETKMDAPIEVTIAEPQWRRDES